MGFAESGRNTAYNIAEKANYATMGVELGLLGFALITMNAPLAVAATGGLALDVAADRVIKSYKKKGSA